MLPSFQTLLCQSTGCGLRFPVPSGSGLGEHCPLCQSPTVQVGPSYTTQPAPPPKETEQLRRVRGLLDNIRSTANLGSIFRTSDGAGIEHLYLGGVCATPENPKLQKTALGSQDNVSWSHSTSSLVSAKQILADGWRLWALEGGDGDSLFDKVGAPHEGTEVPGICLVVGHEVSGIDPAVLELCEQRVHLPSAGIKGSVNVGVAFAVAAYALRYGLTAAQTA